ncbi:MAG: MFS transporter [Pseudomonadales bacterium]|nr:MFS transporter [Pseudomonadales bacterium]
MITDLQAVSQTRRVQLILLLVSAPGFFAGFILPLQARSLGASNLEIGGLFSLFNLMLILLRPLAGTAMDRFGRRRFLMLAVSVFLLSNFFYATAGSVPAIYGARLLHGLATGFILLIADVLVSDWYQQTDRSYALGRNLEMQTRGSIAGATVGFTLLGIVPDLGWQIAFAAFSLAAVGALWLAMTVTEPPADATGQADKSSGGPGSGGPDALLTPGFSAICFLTCITTAGLAAVQPVYVIWLQEHFRWPVSLLALALLPAGIAFALLPSRSSRLIGLFRIYGVMGMGLGISATAYLLMPAIDSAVGFVMLYTLAAASLAVYEPARKQLVFRDTLYYHRGGRLGRTELFAGIGATAGPLAGGWLADQWSGAVVFPVAGAALLFGLLTVFYLHHIDADR